MKFRPLVAGVSCAAILSVAACSSEETGSPVPPGNTAPATSSAPTSAPASSDGSDDANTPLAGTDPCSLLTDQEAAQFDDFHAPKREKVGSADTCSWESIEDHTLKDDFSITTVVRTNAGVDDAVDQGMGVDKVEAKGRRWAQIPDAGGCTLAIGVTSSSRVDVSLTKASDHTIDQACDLADEVAQLVEPKLPKG